MLGNKILINQLFKQVGYKGSEPMCVYPTCMKEKPFSKHGFRNMGNVIIRNQSWF